MNTRLKSKIESISDHSSLSCSKRISLCLNSRTLGYSILGIGLAETSRNQYFFKMLDFALHLVIELVRRLHFIEIFWSHCLSQHSFHWIAIALHYLILIPYIASSSLEQSRNIYQSQAILPGQSMATPIPKIIPHRV